MSSKEIHRRTLILKIKIKEAKEKGDTGRLQMLEEELKKLRNEK